MPTRQDNQSHKGARPFTDREDKIESFWHLFHHLGEREYNVLSFYGVGGVGKTRLRQELISQVGSSPWAKETIISQVLDFDTRDNRPSLRDVERALFTLRNELRQRGIPFRAFDIAYAHYWQQMHPEVALQQKDIPFINESSAIIDLFGGAKDLVESLQEFSTWIVGAGLLPKALTLITFLSKAGKDWLTKRAIERLQGLNLLGVGQLLDELIYFLAYDIRAYLETHNHRIIFFVDTYEALWWEAPQSRSVEHWLERDQWIRYLVAELPHTLWVISGRNQLRWEEVDDWVEYTNEILVGELSVTDSERYLTGCGIADLAIISRIIFSSRGLPFALELQVDQYERIQKTHGPVVDDFAEHPDKLIQRFTEFLTLEELQTLKVLSVTRVWNYLLFLELIRHFQTGYPATALAELSLFSFIIKEGNQYRMHSLMRDELHNRLADKLREECNQVVFNYYDRDLEQVDPKFITPEQEFAFEEALYHRLNIDKIDQTTEWFFNHWDSFYKGSRWALCVRLALEIKKSWQLHSDYKAHENYGRLLTFIGLVYQNLGQYEQALEYDQQALQITQATLGEKHPYTATVMTNIGLVYRDIGQYRQALEYFQQALQIQKATLGEQNPNTALSIGYIGMIYQHLGQYEKALESYQQDLRITLATLGEQDPYTAMVINNIGSLYQDKGQYKQALEYLQRALLIMQFTMGEQHPRVAALLSNMSSVYSNLGQYEQALEYYEQALQIQKATLGEHHPNLAVSTNGIGLVYQQLGQYEQALEYHQRALQIQRATLGEQHPDMALIINNIALVRYYLGQYKQALEYLEQALPTIKEALGEQHPHVAILLCNMGATCQSLNQHEQALNYLQQAVLIYRFTGGEQHPNMGMALYNISSVYLELNKYEQALEYSKQALAIQEVALGEAHPQVVTSLVYIGMIYQHIEQYEQALEYYQQALPIIQTTQGEGHPNTLAILDLISGVRNS